MSPMSEEHPQTADDPTGENQKTTDADGDSTVPVTTDYKFPTDNHGEFSGQGGDFLTT
mgnify:FL=1